MTSAPSEVRAPARAAAPRLALLLATRPRGADPGPEATPAVALPGAREARLALVEPGLPREAAWLALLGQDPRRAWTGPAAFAAAAAGRRLAEDETAWLLDVVRATGGPRAAAPSGARGEDADATAVVRDVLDLPAARRDELLDALARALADGPAPDEGLRGPADLPPARASRLAGEPCAVLRGPRPALVVAERLAGPSTLVEELLLGRPLESFDDGPFARAVRLAGRAAAARLGGPATHVVAHSPGRAGEVTPLREAWPGLEGALVLGDDPAARALTHLLHVDAAPLDDLPARAGQGPPLARRPHAPAQVVIVVGDALALERAARALEGAAVVVVIPEAPDADGVVLLRWTGPLEPAPGPAPLARLACSPPCPRPEAP